MELSGNLYLSSAGRATEAARDTAKAWLEYRGVRYFACGFGESGSPETPVTRLIHGIYSMFPKVSFTVLRSRIFTNYSASTLCRASVALGAKRISDQVPWEPISSAILVESQWKVLSSSASAIAIPDKSRSRSWLAFALELADSVKVEGDRFNSPRQVGAVAVGADGCEISSAVNTNANNKIEHAEMNLLWSLKYSGHTPIFPLTTIYVSLRPCKMCAAAIVHCAQDPSKISVVYAQEDSGPLSQKTELDRLGIIRHEPIDLS